MIAFITGGAEFIGSHLADRLVARGDEVWILDDLSGGAMRNIDHLEDSALFHHRIGSVTDEELVSVLVDRADGGSASCAPTLWKEEEAGLHVRYRTM